VRTSRRRARGPTPIRSRAPADQIESTRREVGPIAAAEGGQAEQASERARLEVDGGENGDAGHAPDAGFLDSLARSQAAYEVPAAVSFPVKRTVRMSA